MAPLQPDKLFIATPMAMVSQRGASLDEHFRLGWIGIYTAEQTLYISHTARPVLQNGAARESADVRVTSCDSAH